MPRRGRKRQKTRTHVTENEAVNALDSTSKVPKTLIIRKGKCNLPILELIQDLRKLWSPYTALQFQEDPKQTLPRYAQHLALPLGISHILQIAQNEERVNLKIARLPAGPLLHFRILEFTNSKVIRASQRRPVSWTPGLANHSALVVTQNIASDAPHRKLLALTIQNLFPQINVSTVRVNECKRVVLWEYQTETDSVQVRHYAIQQRTDETEELEDDTTVTVHNQKVRLREIGPRLSLQLIKVEKGITAPTSTLYHIRPKPAEEVARLQAKHEQERESLAERKRVQEENVRRKQEAKEKKQQKRKVVQLEKEEEIEGLSSSSSEDEGDDSEEA